MAVAVTDPNRKWTTADYILDSMDEDGVRPLSLRVIKSNTPEALRKEVPMLLDIMVENSTLVRVRKDYYVKVVK